VGLACQTGSYRDSAYVQTCSRFVPRLRRACPGGTTTEELHSRPHDSVFRFPVSLADRASPGRRVRRENSWERSDVAGQSASHWDRPSGGCRDSDQNLDNSISRPCLCFAQASPTLQANPYLVRRSCRNLPLLALRGGVVDCCFARRTDKKPGQDSGGCTLGNWRIASPVEVMRRSQMPSHCVNRPRGMGLSIHDVSGLGNWSASRTVNQPRGRLIELETPFCVIH
jgi:hypothetical protein